MFSSGYVCEMSRSKGQRTRFRTRKSRARGMVPGSYWMTPTIVFEPQTSSDGSSSTFAPRLIVPISRYVPPERSISIPSAITCGNPTKSHATSAPTPPVHLRTRLRRSLRSAGRDRRRPRSCRWSSRDAATDVEGVVQGADGELGVLVLDDTRDGDLGRRDHLDVDALAGERGEHRRGDAGVAAHADADDGDLGDPLVVDDPAGADLAGHVRQLGNRPRVIAARQGEGHVGVAVLA